jgi:hypothetical protein
MGRAGIKAMSRDASILAPLGEATDRLIKTIDNATREKDGGKFRDSWAEELGPGVDEWAW